jgi:hypothetical protein
MDILALRDSVSALRALENKLCFLQDAISSAQQESSALLLRYEQERRDVENIERESFSAFLFRLVGKYEDKLEKEQREEIEAKLAYDRAAARLQALNAEHDGLAARISALRADERAYHDELEARRARISQSPGGARYAELENERSGIISQTVEIEEAQAAGLRARDTAQLALKSLESARGWATYDAITRGGIISHIAKYSHIDEAEQIFNTLSSQLRDVKAELTDVHGLSTPGLTEITSTQRAVDFWFDNIFTDMSVRGKIVENIEQIKGLLNKLDKTEAALTAKLRETEAQLAENGRRQEEVLVGM